MDTEGPDVATREQPIGYWLKLVDGLIDRSFDALLGNAGLSRRHWQVLNLLAAAPADGPGLVEALRPFRNDTGPTIEGILADLRSRGWAQTSGHGLHSLTS